MPPPRPSLGGGNPAAAPVAAGVDGQKMLKELNIPNMLYMIVGLHKSLVEKIFDVKKEFSYNGQDPRMVSDLMMLIQTNSGVPEFENIIEQISKKVEINKVVITNYFPLFMKLESPSEEKSEITDFLNKIGMSSEDLADQLEYFHDPQKGMIEFRLSRFYKLIFQV